MATYACDDAGRRTSASDALNHVTTFGYDAAGNQTSVKDANNKALMCTTRRTGSQSQSHFQEYDSVPESSTKVVSSTYSRPQ